MKKEYSVKLCCATCGCNDHFEFNEAQSYIKCTFCNREYFGGIEELKELNKGLIDEIKEVNGREEIELERQISNLLSELGLHTSGEATYSKYYKDENFPFI